VDLSVISVGLLAAAMLAIGVGALAKGITGVGLPILAVPPWRLSPALRKQ